MDIVTDANELVRRFRRHAFTGDLPTDLAERLQSIPGSQADVLTTGAEILYAHFDVLDAGGKELVGQLYSYADQQGWTTFNKDGRSSAIVALVRRDLGEKGRGVAAKAAEYPEPETNRRDGVDWRASAGKAAEPEA